MDIMQKIRSRVNVDESTGCWIWQGSNNGSYGNVWYNGKLWLLHRLVFTQTRGEIPTGVNVCHSCDFTLCGNPEHLFLGTQQDNMDDACRKGRMAKGHRHYKSKLSESDIVAIISRINSGETWATVAAAFNVASSQIYEIIHGGRYDANRLGPINSRKSRKLTEESVRQIRILYGNGISSAALAEQFKVVPSCIRSIIAGRTWKHVQ